MFERSARRVRGESCITIRASFVSSLESRLSIREPNFASDPFYPHRDVKRIICEVNSGSLAKDYELK
jgi:hypothetical protein